MDPVDVARVETDRVARLGRRVAELEEVVGHLRRTGHLARTLEAEDENVEHEAVVLQSRERERRSTPRGDRGAPGR